MAQSKDNPIGGAVAELFISSNVGKDGKSRVGLELLLVVLLVDGSSSVPICAFPSGPCDASEHRQPGPSLLFNTYELTHSLEAHFKALI